MEYAEDDMLMLSGIQHFMFCPRQWALIHIEQQWDENRLTVEGQLLHTNVDNPFYRQKNGDVITLRSVTIASKKLGLYGITDAIELKSTQNESNAIKHPTYPGFWLPYPIEYKRGHSKPDERDEVQLSAQVICLEEMYHIHIPEAALYYGETRHREVITISDDLRVLTQSLADEMHSIYRKGCTPKAELKPHCKNCSLLNLCLPQLSQRSSASNYLRRNFYEEIT